MRRALYILAFIIAAQVNLSAQDFEPDSADESGEAANGLIITLWKPAVKPPFVRYRDIPFWQESLHLDRFASELQQQPDMTGFLIASSEPGEESEKSARRMEEARNYLIFAYNIKADRLLLVRNCGFGKTEYTLRIESPGKYFSNSPPIVKLDAKVGVVRQ